MLMHTDISYLTASFSSLGILNLFLMLMHTDISYLTASFSALGILNLFLMLMHTDISYLTASFSSLGILNLFLMLMYNDISYLTASFSSLGILNVDAGWYLLPNSFLFILGNLESVPDVDAHISCLEVLEGVVNREALFLYPEKVLTLSHWKQFQLKTSCFLNLTC